MGSRKKVKRASPTPAVSVPEPNPGQPGADPGSWNSWGAVTVLVLLGLCWHGLLLSNDGMIWDSWYVKPWLDTKNWRAIHEFFGSVGMPVYGWLYCAFSIFSDLIGAFMAATVLCLVLQGVQVYGLAQKLGGLSARESFCIAALAQSVPLFSASQDLSIFFFLLMQTLFLLAAHLAARVVEGTAEKTRFLRGAACLLFLLSFSNAALLVFYGGFYLLLFIKGRPACVGSLRSDFLKFCTRYPDFLFLPPVAWVLRNVFTPQYGWYADYNNPLSNLPRIGPSFRSFFANVIPYHVRDVCAWCLDHPVLLAFFAGAVVAGALRGSRRWAVPQSPARTLSLVAFGAGLLFFAIFPYAAAGKTYEPVPVGDQSRYAILAGLPVAVLGFALLRAVLGARRANAGGSRWLMPGCLAVAVILGCQIPKVYLGERAEWILHRSILQHAVQSRDVQQSSVVILQNWRMTGQIVYGTYAFGSAFGDFRRLVTPAAPQNRESFSPMEVLMQIQRTTMPPNTFKDINPAGQQVLVVAERNAPTASEGDLVWRYLRLKWSGNTAAMHEFLAGLTTVRTRVLKPAQPLIPALAGAGEEMPLSGESFANSTGMQMVALSSGMWVARHETTQEQYQKVTGQNPSLFVDPRRPVERVSWEDAVGFCEKLNQAEKAAGRLPEGRVYRLPTVAEFEGFSANTALQNAVLAGAVGPLGVWHTQPVGSRGANALGLCDTVGNVWEWTADWADKGRRMKVAAGGGFANSPPELALHPQRDQPMDFYTRSVVRRLFGPTRPDYPDQALWDRGFRVVLAQP